MNTFTHIAFAALLGAVSMTTYAASHSAAPAASAQSAHEMTEGEIRKINKDTKKLTIKHAELKNFEMPAMTMVFGVKDPAMLDSVKPGSKVRFMAEKIDGQFVVTHLEVQP